MEQVNRNGLKEPNIGLWVKPIISVCLGLALIFSLLPKNHQRAKFDISEILTTVWLVYSIYYKDYPVMVICIIILTYSLSQTPNEQVMAWP
jgi:hypothetical protein